jgi:hypothetical protein
MAQCLPDDERSSIGSDNHAIRKEQFVRNDGCSTSRIDEDDHAGFDRFGRRIYEIVADIPHVQTPFGVHDAVTQTKCGEAADVGHLLQGSTIHTMNPALKRIANQHSSLRGEPEAVGDEG